MKFFSVTLALMIVLSSACMRHEQLASPQELNFSSLHFNGNIMLNSINMPVQGALTHKEGNLKFVIMTQTGILLGHGWLEQSTGDAHITFSRSITAKKMLQKIGYTLAMFLNSVPKLSEKDTEPYDVQLPQAWTFQPQRDTFFYHDAQLSISIPRESIQ